MMNLVSPNLISINDVNLLLLFGAYVAFWCVLFSLHKLTKVLRYS